MTATKSAALIAVDWGSSSFRAFLLDHNGTILDKVTSDQGILVSAQDANHAEILEKNCAVWTELYGPLPTLMSGMVGSRNGWIETGYVPCPASAKDLATALVTVPTNSPAPTKIVPGVCGPGLFGKTDVMRGEEIQILGALAYLGRTNAMVCLPGTHSKWCETRDAKIQSVATYMTGELFALVCSSSSIGSLVNDAEFDEDSFLNGCRTGNANGVFANALFSVRADTLTGNLDCKSPSSYLSGLLIGQELSAAISGVSTAHPIIVVGNDTLTHRYGIALASMGLATEPLDSDTAFLKGVTLLT